MYRRELRRAVATGIWETAGQTFLLLIAVRDLQAGAWAKGLVAAGSSVGLMLSPLLTSAVSARGASLATTVAWFYRLSAVCFLAVAVWPVVPVFVVLCMTGLAAVAVTTPLLTQMYQDNYPDTARGRLFSRSVMVRVAAGALFAELAGRWIAVDRTGSRGLLVVYALAMLFAAAQVAEYPSGRLRSGGGSHPLRALRWVRDDALFRRTLVCWMLMGFANLMMVPLRVEYLANPRHGLAHSAATVALLTAVIPNAMRLVMSPIWGWVFDRVNFFALRVVLNLGFALGILTFFTSDTMTGLLTGAVLFGVAMAGGDVAWTLWVTKIAPPDRVAEYMSVHTFFTGLRGMAAPVAVFHLVMHLSVATVSAISAALIVLATLILLREVRGQPARDPGRVVVERSVRAEPP